MSEDDSPHYSSVDSESEASASFEYPDDLPGTPKASPVCLDDPPGTPVACSPLSQDSTPGTPDIVPTSPEKFGPAYVANDASDPRTNDVDPRKPFKNKHQKYERAERTNDKKRTEVTHSLKSDFDGVEYQEYSLRTVDVPQLRDFVLAKFSSEHPNISDSSEVRLFRDAESTVLQRQSEIEKMDEFNRFLGSFLGQQKKLYYSRFGNELIPYRYLSDWSMEVEQKRSSGNDSDTSEQHETETESFAGQFMGLAPSRYAAVVLRDENLADVMLLDPYAWTYFRPRCINSYESTGDRDAQHRLDADVKKRKDAEKKRDAKEKEDLKKLSKLQKRSEEMQEMRDRLQGDDTRTKKKGDFAPIGMRRSKQQSTDAGEDDKEVAGNTFDFTPEFDSDNDEQGENPRLSDEENGKGVEDEDEGNDLCDDDDGTDKRKKKFRMFLSDPDSESDSASSSDRSDERRTSVNKKEAKKKTGNGARGSSSLPGKEEKVMPQLPIPNRSRRERKDPNAGPRGPRNVVSSRPDLSHILPPKGEAPTVEHVRKVVKALSKDTPKVSLRTCVSYFENKTKEQKDHLKKVIQKAATFKREKVDGKQTMFLFLKQPSGAEAGPSRL